MHIGKPTEEEAKQKNWLYTSAYTLLTDNLEREKAEKEFMKALQQPFVIGGRVFSIGALYGIRIYISGGYGEAIIDTRRLLTSDRQTSLSYKAHDDCTIHGIRNSIMESQLADLLEIYFSDKEVGHFKKVHEDAFIKRSRGGLDDLVWIRNNDLAADYFLKRKFKEAAGLFDDINRMVQDNTVFMYRRGICLEALAAQSRSNYAAEENWKSHMETAISLYEKSLNKLRKRKGAWLDSGYVKGFEPRSMLTIMMQLADAYAQMGAIGWLRSKKLWGEILEIDPSCYEAKRKVGLALQLPMRVAGLLSHHPRS